MLILPIYSESGQKQLHFLTYEIYYLSISADILEVDTGMETLR